MKHKKTYTLNNLMNALRDVKRKKYNVTVAAKIHNVPRQTLSDKIKGKSPATLCKRGPDPLLGHEVESQLCNWITHNSEIGFSTTKESVLYSVNKIIEMHKEQKLQSYFRNKTLGEGWFKAFKKRYPDLNFKKPEISNYAPSKIEIQNWFRKIRKHLSKDTEILSNPTRIFCIGEMSLCVTKSDKKNLSFNFNDKASVLFGANAAALFIPPMVQMKYQVLPETSESVFNGCKIMNSRNKMTCEAFHEYLVNIFYPYLIERDILFPVVAFVDVKIGCTSYPLYEFCKEKSIYLLSFIPNSISVLQPLEMGFFQSFKEAWTAELNLGTENGVDMNDEEVGAQVYRIMRFVEFDDILKQSFRKCGLFPFNSDAVYETYTVKTNNLSKNRVSNLLKETEQKLNKTDVIESVFIKSESTVDIHSAENYIIEEYSEEEIEINDKESETASDSYFCEESNFKENLLPSSTEIHVLKRKAEKAELSSPDEPNYKKILLIANMTEKSEPDLNFNLLNITAVEDDDIDTLKKKNQDLQTLLRKVIDLLKEKTNICLNLEKQNSALNAQVASIKEVVSLTKSLLTIRNEEVENMQKDMSSLQEKINEEKERHNKMFETANKVNDEIKGIYQTNMELFQQLKEKYAEKESLLLQENNNLKNELKNLKANFTNTNNENS